MTALGSGTNTASVYTRDGRTLLHELNADQVKWDRRLCSISEAAVRVPASGCGRWLNSIHPWAHSLVIHRDGERVWEGPVKTRRDSAEGLTLTARDVLRWTQRRVTSHRIVTASNVITELGYCLTAAYGSDDPNVLAHIQTIASGAPSAASYETTRGEKYWDEVLTDLVGQGGRYTVVGRRIVIWDVGTELGRLPDLSPEEHLGINVETVEEGDDLANMVLARNDQGLTSLGFIVDRSYYGQVTVILPSKALTEPGLNSDAYRVLGVSHPQPIQLDMPSDAKLQCNAPFPISRLVPGIVWPVTVTTATERRISQTMTLDSVTVEQQAGAPEDVKIGLINSSGDQA